MYLLCKCLYCKWILSCARNYRNSSRARARARAERVRSRIKLRIKSVVAVAAINLNYYARADRGISRMPESGRVRDNELRPR